ncbi:WXG100 family type VII secretion target [Nonomuraea rhodomycinica]|uniref:WXG100 family type VII secretion target n=1 Tax=Nonomuraea rhodomycinica TaxID=1712872 RepID=A0A7Y6IN92_9ACTN|nr:WXG100 family type VII secretion target [Nonomuraea rhodomycinica]NUW40960.1 WXG100 family type VII secretion target [Nonomuraea rhodomycinica]
MADIDAALAATSPTSLKKAAGYCQTTAQYIEGQRRRVQDIKAYIMVNWESNAARAFGRALDQWDIEFNQVIKILEGIYDKLNIGAGVYANAADDDMDLVQGLMNTGQTGGIDSLINTHTHKDEVAAPALQNR